MFLFLGVGTNRSWASGGVPAALCSIAFLAKGCGALSVFG